MSIYGSGKLEEKWMTKKNPLNLEELCDISAKDVIEYYCQNAILSMDLNLLRVSLQEKLKIIV